MLLTRLAFWLALLSLLPGVRALLFPDCSYLFAEIATNNRSSNHGPGTDDGHPIYTSWKPKAGGHLKK